MTQLQQLGAFLGRKMNQQTVDFNDFKLATELQFTQNNQTIENNIATAMQEAKDHADNAVGTLQGDVFQIKTQLDADIASEHSGMLTAIAEVKQEAQAYTDGAIANLVGTAPQTLDTIDEIAQAVEANREVLETISELAGNHTHLNATPTVAGFMSAEDKTALDNVGTYEQMVAAFNAVVGVTSPLYEVA